MKDGKVTCRLCGARLKLLRGKLPLHTRSVKVSDGYVTFSYWGVPEQVPAKYKAEICE